MVLQNSQHKEQPMRQQWMMAALLLLGACAPSTVVVRHPQTGDVQECRRGWWGTVNTMKECASPYLAKGYVEIDPDAPLPPAPAQAAVPAMPEVPAVPHQPLAPYQGYQQPQAPAVVGTPAAPVAMPPEAAAPVTAPGAAPATPAKPEAKAEEEKPYFSQYPTSTSHKGWVLPEVFQ
jgi:hypothetical protein